MRSLTASLRGGPSLPQHGKQPDYIFYSSLIQPFTGLVAYHEANVAIYL